MANNQTASVSAATTLKGLMLLGEVSQAALQRAPARLSFRQRFTNRFGEAVVTCANRCNWSPFTRELVHEYIVSLLKGDGSAPKALGGRPLEMVQQRFALCCYRMRANPGSFPGQSQDWFEERLKEAADFWEGQKTQPPAA